MLCDQASPNSGDSPRTEDTVPGPRLSPAGAALGRAAYKPVQLVLSSAEGVGAASQVIGVAVGELQAPISLCGFQ